MLGEDPNCSRSVLYKSAKEVKATFAFDDLEPLSCAFVAVLRELLEKSPQSCRPRRATCYGQDHLHTVLLTMSDCEYVSQLLARISEPEGIVSK